VLAILVLVDVKFDLGLVVNRGRRLAAFCRARFYPLVSPILSALPLIVGQDVWLSAVLSGYCPGSVLASKEELAFAGFAMRKRPGCRRGLRLSAGDRLNALRLDLGNDWGLQS
jgi:hypothetical protein